MNCFHPFFTEVNPEYLFTISVNAGVLHKVNGETEVKGVHLGTVLKYMQFFHNLHFPGIFWGPPHTYVHCLHWYTVLFLLMSHSRSFSKSQFPESLFIIRYYNLSGESYLFITSISFLLKKELYLFLLFFYQLYQWLANTDVPALQKVKFELRYKFKSGHL